jgi:hypothetical protein
MGVRRHLVPRLLLLLSLLAPGCVLIPAGHDARTNGIDYEAGREDPWQCGQPGVEDLRTSSQNDIAIGLP